MQLTNILALLSLAAGTVTASGSGAQSGSSNAGCVNCDYPSYKNNALCGNGAKGWVCPSSSSGSGSTNGGSSGSTSGGGSVSGLTGCVNCNYPSYKNNALCGNGDKGMTCPSSFGPLSGCVDCDYPSYKNNNLCINGAKGWTCPSPSSSSSSSPSTGRGSDENTNGNGGGSSGSGSGSGQPYPLRRRGLHRA